MKFDKLIPSGNVANDIVKSIHWFRRDFRLDDNAALSAACAQSDEVIPVFIFDTDILDKLEDKDDSRVNFIHRRLKSIKSELQKMGSDLRVYCGSVDCCWNAILDEWKPQAVFTNEDYEPYARDRDDRVQEKMTSYGVEFHAFKDQVVFHKDEVVKDNGEPYTVYTPYRKKWMRHFQPEMIAERRVDQRKFAKIDARPMISLDEMGFQPSSVEIPEPNTSESLLRNYAETRDLPAKDATTHISTHLRFGTVSIRACYRKALKISDTWVGELIWRSFFSQLLYHFPHVVDQEFKSKYKRIPWRYSESDFEIWTKGETGIPIVDAGMRELALTGFMHNRVRMICASFLTKNLLIDWRWGEAWFARKLTDYELASNNGNWQWAAGCGADAAPYFRVFNPETQREKFDPKWKYVKKWVPEYGTLNYPSPMVDLKATRKRCIETFKTALDQAP